MLRGAGRATAVEGRRSARQGQMVRGGAAEREKWEKVGGGQRGGKGRSEVQE